MPTLLRTKKQVQIRRKEEGRKNQKSCARYSLKQKDCFLISSKFNEDSRMDFEIMYSFD